MKEGLIMYDNKISNKTLAIILFPIYLLIALCLFFFIAIYRVDAAFYDVNVTSITAQYYGSTATLMGDIKVNNSNGFNYYSQYVVPPLSPPVINPGQIATIFYVIKFDTINIKSNSHNSISISYSTYLGLEPSEFLIGGRSYSTTCNVQNLSFDESPRYYYNCNLEFDWLNTSFDLNTIRVYFNHSGNAENGGVVNFSVRGRMYYYDLQNTIQAIETFKQQSHDDAIAQQNQAKQIAEEQKKRDDASLKEQQEINSNLKDTQDYLTDDSDPNSDISSLGNVQGLLPSGPLDSLLNIPFEFLSILTTSFSGTCKPLSGKWVFDTTLTIPCFTDIIYDKVPDALMIFIDLVPTSFILILYFKHLYKKVERATSLESNSDDEWGVI